MEGLVCKNSGVEITTISASGNGEVVLLEKTPGTKEKTPDEGRYPENKDSSADVVVVNGSESPRITESQIPPELQKASGSSPTLIGSAFKVMKNLFSPDKPKSKHSGVLSPIYQQKNAAGAPCGSVCISGKTELFCTESEISFHSGENLKNNFPNNEAAVLQAPLTMENLSNTDESFLTTVSIIDDSFHSAVTDFDDNGDPRVVAALQTSQNLDYVNPCNDTQKTNESNLENTTLKLSGAEDTSDASSLQCKDGSLEMLNDTRSFVINSDHSLKSPGNELIRKEGKLNNVLSGSMEPADVVEKPSSEEEVKTNEKMEMADLFLNNAFEKSPSQQSGLSINEFGSSAVDTWKYSESEMRGKESEVLFESSNHTCFLGDSFSTTTVVLDTSRDFDTSLQAGDFDMRSSSLNSIEDNGTAMTTSSGKAEKPVGDRPLNGKTGKQHSDSCNKWLGPTQTRLLSPQKKCDGNSPSNRSNTGKVKFNKSDELTNRRTSCEPPDGKNNCSVDISLMKNFESSELSEGFVLKDQSEVGKSEMASPANKTDTHAITSQLSYTVLVNHNNVLNRPVIDSHSFTYPENQAFQAARERVSSNGLSDTSYCGTPEMKQSTPLWSGSKGQSGRSPLLKLNSPELKQTDRGETNEPERTHNAKTNLSSKVMEMFRLSPVSPGDGRDFSFPGGGVVSGTPRDLGEISGKANKTSEKNSGSPWRNGTSASPSPQREGNNLYLTFDKSSASPKTKMGNSTFVKSRESFGADRTFNVAASPDPSQMYKTFDRPVSRLNQTFDSKGDGLGAQKLNETFDKKSPLHSKINQVVGSCQEKIAQEMNKTFDSVPIAETTQSAEAEAGKGKKQTKEADPQSNALPPDVIKSENGKDSYDSPLSSKNSLSVASSDLSTALLNDDIFPSSESFDLPERHERVDPNGKIGETVSLPKLRDTPDDLAEEKLLNSLKEDKLQYDPELVQLIQEQFSSKDIEKICSVVQDFSALKLSSDIMKASEQFDKSFHGNIPEVESKPAESETKLENPGKPLSPKSFDFLSSIGGKPTGGRDWSRESLYVKFDPLVQPNANSLIDFTKEGEALPPQDDSPAKPQNSSICEQLLNISPQKKSDDIVPPLIPISHKTKADENESRAEKLKELQNEIYFLKNLYAEREKANKTKAEEYESQITKMTGDICFLEDKLKVSNERERSLVKKMKEQAQNIGQLNVIMEEYVKIISKLTTEVETLRAVYMRQVENLVTEKDSYMTHLQNTEAAFTDVHTKYEKSKKTIVSLKANETMFRNTIAEQAHKLEELKAKAREAEDRAEAELQKVRDDLAEAKGNHVMENARLRAQLRKTELKVEALQESLDQKIKENQQLTAICDELIEGKKSFAPN